MCYFILLELIGIDIFLTISKQIKTILTNIKLI